MRIVILLFHEKAHLQDGRVPSTINLMGIHMTETHSSRSPIGRSRLNRDEIVGRRNGLGAAGVSTGLFSALYLLPAVAQAGVVYVSGSPITLSLNDPVGTTVSWDVDGIDGPEFQVFRASFGGSQSIQIGSVNATFAPLNGRGFVGPGLNSDDVQALPLGFNVGPTLAAYAWGVSGYRYRNAMYNAGGGAQIGYDMVGFAAGQDGYIGFRFNALNGLEYGWATINIDPTTQRVTIRDWAYNDTPNAPVQVPEPSTAALTLLGLGAAGVRAWRARKKPAAGAS
jgi:hypothetical protein